MKILIKEVESFIVVNSSVEYNKLLFYDHTNKNRLIVA